MKKALMVMSFAMCASIAFAQTVHFSPKAQNESYKVSMKDLKSAPVDYKASIFTKDEPVDTLATFTFASDAMTGINYGSSCKLTANDMLDNQAVGTNAHSIDNAKSYWFHISDSTWFAENVGTDFSGIGDIETSWGAQYIANCMSPTANNVADDGFMLISLEEVSMSTNKFNTYFSLPAVANPDVANTKMIEIRVTQAYRKYYDATYIDYKVNGNWRSREVNVTGVDCEVNGVAPRKIRWTMPHNLRNQDNIEIRFRMFNDGTSGNAYGYFWAVDNVAIVHNPNTENWNLATERAIDGFYGQIPQGMSIPMSYAVNAQNLSAYNVRINDAHINVMAGAEGQEFSLVAEGPHKDFIANDISTLYTIGVDERGFINLDSVSDHGYQAWPIQNGPNYGATTLSGGYLGRSLPTTTAGANYYQMVAEGGTSRHTEFDTVLYTVTDFYEAPSASHSRYVSGYRLGRDNGLVPSYSAFRTAFSDDGFVTTTDQDGHCGMLGYGVHIRYATGAVIPTDDNNEPWVFRGIEYVPCTDSRNPSNMVNAQILPVLYKEVITEDSSISFQSVPCGIDGIYFGVDESMLNTFSSGYRLPDQNYNAINVKFLQQTELEPNTYYRLGYRLASNNGTFALAAQQRYFIDQDSNIVYYSEDPATAPYYNQNMVATYLDAIILDPAPNERDAHQITGWNIDNFPMMRLIVGPRDEVEMATIVVDGNLGDSLGFCVDNNFNTHCNEHNAQYELPAGSYQRFDISYPHGDDSARYAHTVITKVTVDGQELAIYDEEEEVGDMIAYSDNVLDENGNVLLYRDAYYFNMEALDASVDHSIIVELAYEDFNTSGIDPVAANVGLRMTPNPATSTVKLNVTGVTGMVNCNIIDMSGRVVYNANVNAESETTVDVSNLPAGAYFVRITNDNMSKIEKLIIK
jgi:hypothetical protein